MYHLVTRVFTSEERAGTYRMTCRVTDSDRNTRVSDADTRTFTITVQARGDFPPRFSKPIADKNYTATSEGSAAYVLSTLPAATDCSCVPGPTASRSRMWPSATG